jgi:hypothetical protein
LSATSCYDNSGNSQTDGALPTATPTLDAGADATIPAAEARLAAENPDWTTFVNAIQSSDVPTVLGFLRWQDRPCTPVDSRIGDSPTCADLGVEDGVAVPMLPVTNVPLPTVVVDPKQSFEDIGWDPKPQVSSTFSTLLKDRHPALQLVAAGDDGRIYLTFSLDPQKDSTGFLVNGLTFQMQSSSAPLVNIYAEVGNQASPLGAIQEGEQRGGQHFEIWGVSPELEAEEAAIQRARHQP